MANYLVIGGNSGIGLETVKKLSATNTVYVLAKSIGNVQNMPNVHAQTFDVTEQELPLGFLPDSLEGLVYAPGSINLKPFARIKKEDFLADWEINFYGAVKSIQAVLPHLKKSESASSIVLFSTVAVQTGLGFHASIAAAKGAVEGLTKSLAAEFAPKIRVNAVAPSLTNTQLAQGLLNTENKVEASKQRHPLKIYGEPQDVASLVSYLVSPEARFITGQIIQVDGGLSSLKV